MNESKERRLLTRRDLLYTLGAGSLLAAYYKILEALLPIILPEEPAWKKAEIEVESDIKKTSSSFAKAVLSGDIEGAKNLLSPDIKEELQDEKKKKTFETNVNFMSKWCGRAKLKEPAVVDISFGKAPVIIPFEEPCPIEISADPSPPIKGFIRTFNLNLKRLDSEGRFYPVDFSWKVVA